MDRKMIKWEPFNSVISSSKMIKDVLKEKEKIKKPILSEEQLLLINNQILEHFQTKEQVQITYYENGYINKITEYIKKIDSVNKKVYLTNGYIYFNQIIKIN